MVTARDLDCWDAPPKSCSGRLGEQPKPAKVADLSFLAGAGQTGVLGALQRRADLLLLPLKEPVVRTQKAAIRAGDQLRPCGAHVALKELSDRGRAPHTLGRLVEQRL